VEERNRKSAATVTIEFFGRSYSIAQRFSFDDLRAVKTLARLETELEAALNRQRDQALTGETGKLIDRTTLNMISATQARVTQLKTALKGVLV
jgi:hypothetical protein